MPAAISEHQDAIALRTSRPQSLIFTIYGAYSRSLGGWIAVSSLLALLREMNIEDNAVRSALSRLKRRGVLLSEAHNGFAGYALSDSARKAFDTGDARVLERRHPEEETRWILVAFSIPEKSRDLRYRLRSRLTGVGFGQVTGGLWIAPASLRADAELAIDTLGIHQYVHLFEADHLESDSTGAGSTDEGSVQQWWDLDAIEKNTNSSSRLFPNCNKLLNPVRSPFLRRMRFEITPEFLLLGAHCLISIPDFPTHTSHRIGKAEPQLNYSFTSMICLPNRHRNTYVKVWIPRYNPQSTLTDAI